MLPDIQVRCSLTCRARHDDALCICMCMRLPLLLTTVLQCYSHSLHFVVNKHKELTQCVQENGIPVCRPSTSHSAKFIFFVKCTAAPLPHLCSWAVVFPFDNVWKRLHEINPLPRFLPLRKLSVLLNNVWAQGPRPRQPFAISMWTWSRAPSRAS